MINAIFVLLLYNNLFFVGYTVALLLHTICYPHFTYEISFMEYLGMLGSFFAIVLPIHFLVERCKNGD